VVFWLNAKLVVDGVMQSLFAAKIALGGLDRNMLEQELDLEIGRLAFINAVALPYGVRETSPSR